jgi:SAM-dependent methyltransferase
LPSDAAEVLRRDHPLLNEYDRRYLHHAAAGSQWSSEYTRNAIDLRYFRGDNAFVWQPHDRTDEIRYALTTYYTRLHDRHRLLERLTEDGLFGAYTYEIDGVAVSRDLLDSIAELMFLDDELAIGSRAATILDIGAGYGRLAHRATTAYQNITYLCTDAVPESTFLSEFYLDYRGVADRARVLPLDEVAAAIEDEAIDVAVNVHSFSECPLSAIEWWLDLLAANGVEYLMIVPNTEGALLSTERAMARVDFMPAIQARQFELICARPKYANSEVVQRHGLFPTTYFLFRRQHS